MKVLWIRVDDGETFEGTLEQFRDCFYSDANRENIQEGLDEIFGKGKCNVEFSEKEIEE